LNASVQPTTASPTAGILKTYWPLTSGRSDGVAVGLPSFTAIVYRPVVFFGALGSGGVEGSTPITRARHVPCPSAGTVVVTDVRPPSNATTPGTDEPSGRMSCR